jgi:hypothetical protein
MARAMHVVEAGVIVFAGCGGGRNNMVDGCVDEWYVWEIWMTNTYANDKYEVKKVMGVINPSPIKPKGTNSILISRSDFVAESRVCFLLTVPLKGFLVVSGSLSSGSGTEILPKFLRESLK